MMPNKTTLTGAEALIAFNAAAKLVKEGDFEAARKVELLPSDRIVIEQRIAEAQKRID